MSRVVFVHGIGQKRPPDELATSWWEALRDGLDEQAAVGPITPLSRDEVAMAGWAHHYRGSGAQGGPAMVGDLEDLADDPYAVALAEAWIRTAASSGDPELRAFAEPLVTEIDDARAAEAGGDAQGIGAIGRRILKLLARLPIARSENPAVIRAARLGSLNEVLGYFADPDLRERCKQEVHDTITGDTRVVISHSMGTVIAYEALHESVHRIPLLITLGSPLGLEVAVRGRLLPDASFPPKVDAWVNVADDDDVISGQLALSGLFPSTAGLDVHDRLIDNANTWAHGIAGYLRNLAVAQPVAHVLGATRPA